MTTAAVPHLTLKPGVLVRLYVIRAGAAIAWAIAFATTSSSLGAAAIALLIAYPAIDVVASAVDAHANPANRKVQWANAAVSTAALAAVAVATSFDNRAVLLAFGVWATVSGVIQLVVAVRRRRQFGTQTSILISGALSTVAGIGFAAMSRADDPTLINVAGYAALGGVLFAVAAVTLRHRSARA